MKSKRFSLKALKKILVNWQFILVIGLVAISALIYTIHYFIFKDPHHIFIYLVSDIAFVPMEVLLVTIIIHKLLDKKEKDEKIKKLNMIIGAFFSELGTPFIKIISDLDKTSSELLKMLHEKDFWQKKVFSKKISELVDYRFSLEVTTEDLSKIKEFICSKKDFQLNLLANSNLLEHDTFTDMLWAVFHVTEELQAREGFENSSEKDRDHLKKDVERAYAYLIKEWFLYLKHLKSDYPYLFALALRLNPLNPAASPIVE